ncbi:MAG: polysaccharide deacetylase family protein [Pseudomonadota bacterium]
MPGRTIRRILTRIATFVGAYGIVLFLATYLPPAMFQLFAIGWTLLAFFSALFLLDMIVPWFNVLTPAISRLPRDAGNAVALTFDDGPVEPYTREILDTLDRRGAKATFFCLGRNVEKHPELTREIVRRGHAIGNHTYSHRILPYLTPAACRAEISHGRDVIERVSGVRPTLVRAPKGYKSPLVNWIISRMGGKLIGFSYPIFDTQNPPVEELVSRVLSRVRAGDIIVMHDGYSPDGSGERSSLVTALDPILDGFEKKGLRTVTLDSL